MGGRFLSFSTVPGNSFLRSPGTCLPGLTKLHFLQLWILASNIALQVCGGYCMRSEHRKKKKSDRNGQWTPLMSLLPSKDTGNQPSSLHRWRPLTEELETSRKVECGVRQTFAFFEENSHEMPRRGKAFCYPCLTTPLNPPLALGCQLQRDHSLAPADRPAEVSARTECPEKLP